jgi:hypothetical protein
MKERVQLRVRARALRQIARLIAEGRVVMAREDHRTLSPPPVFPGPPLSEVVRQMRDEDRGDDVLYVDAPELTPSAKFDFDRVRRGGLAHLADPPVVDA